MTLKEKFKQWLDTDPREQIREVPLEIIADEFAIEFADWKDINCVYYDGWNIRVPLGDKYSDVYTNEELLKIFKKEKGL